MNDNLHSIELQPSFHGPHDGASYKINRNINIYKYVYDGDENIDAFIKKKSNSLIATDNDLVTCKNMSWPPNTVTGTISIK